MESQILQVTDLIAALVSATVVVGFLGYFLSSGAHECYRCNLRITSV